MTVDETTYEIVRLAENPGPYRIRRHQRYDENSEVIRQWFEVEQQTKGWFRTKWRPWKHCVLAYDDLFSVVTEFKSKADAQRAISRHASGIPRDGIVSSVVWTGERP